jgi:hypothetical protein
VLQTPDVATDTADVFETTDTGMQDTAGTTCAALSDCCSAMNGTNATNDQTSCQQLVSAGVDSACAALLQTYQDAGACS